MSSELDKYLDLLLSYENPILFTIIFSFILFGFAYLFLRYLYFPIKNKYSMDKHEWELREAKLMSVFAELDPDPLFRIDSNGSILLVNESAKDMFPEKELLGDQIDNIINELNRDFSKIINDDDQEKFNAVIFERNFSGIIKGIKTLDFAQIYLHDISEKIETQQQLIKSQNELKQLTIYLDANLEKERKNISRELHDVIGQKVHLLKLKFQNFRSNKDIIIKNILDDISGLYADVRNISRSLKPPLMDEFGVAAAINSTIEVINKDSDITGSFVLVGAEERFEEQIELCLFRVAQESMTNLLKHSRASEFLVQLNNSNEKLKLFISDDGIGFNYEESMKNKITGLGLINMRERVESLGGSIIITSYPNEGTTIVVIFDKVN